MKFACGPEISCIDSDTLLPYTMKGKLGGIVPYIVLYTVEPRYKEVGYNKTLL